MKPALDVLIALAALAFPLTIVGSVMFWMRNVTGWDRLARQFPAKPPSHGAPGGITSLYFYRFLHYGNCVRWHADDDHLHLSLIPPFSWLFHPPMSIPWAAIEFVDTRPRWGLIKFRVQGIPISTAKRVMARELELREAIAASPPPVTAG